VFQVERGDGIRVSVDRCLDHEFIVGMGAGRPPVVVENNGYAETRQCIQNVRDIRFGCPSSRQICRPAEHPFTGKVGQTVSVYAVAC
jgi:hypothetical protein